MASSARRRRFISQIRARPDVSRLGRTASAVFFDVIPDRTWLKTSTVSVAAFALVKSVTLTVLIERKTAMTDAAANAGT